MAGCRLVCIEGNIGAGKSTVLTCLRTRGYTVIPEPVHTWSHIFPLFVEQPKRYAFTFQTQIAASLIEQYRTAISACAHAPKDNIIFIERSFVSAGCFVDVAVANGYISAAEEQTYHNLARLIAWTPSEYVFVATPLATCLQRIKVRARTEETGVTLGNLMAIASAFCKAGITSKAVDGSKTPDEIAIAILDRVIPNSL